MSHTFETLTLREVLGILRRRAVLIVMCAVLLGVAAYGFSKLERKRYTATAALAFSDNSLSQEIAGLPPSYSTNALAQQASDLELVRLGDMAARTAAVLGHGLTEQQVAGSVSAAAQGESSVVTVSATAASPALAAAIANTYSNEFVAEQQSSNRAYFASALALVERQLARLPGTQRTGPDGVALQDRAQTLGLLAELRYGNVQLTQPALAPRGPSSPRTSRNTVLAILLGGLIGIGLALALERLDTRVRRPDELAEIHGRPLLGTVPDDASLARSVSIPPGALSPAALGSFNAIRAHMRLLAGGALPHVLLLASGQAGDGTTTVARNLAQAAARASKRVLLIEADLRRATLAAALDLQPSPGLADVLLGAVSMPEATHSVDGDAGAGAWPGERRLDVLPAGGLVVVRPGPAARAPRGWARSSRWHARSTSWW